VTAKAFERLKIIAIVEQSFLELLSRRKSRQGPTQGPNTIIMRQG
jgi:hypothetical protein